MFSREEHLRVAYVLISAYDSEAAFARPKARPMACARVLDVGAEKYHSYNDKFGEDGTIIRPRYD